MRRSVAPTSSSSCSASPSEANAEDADTGDQGMIDQIEELLMVVSDEYCNKHLLYGVLELVLVRLMPELSEKGVKDLWDERLGPG